MSRKLIDLKKLAETDAAAIEGMKETLEGVSGELWTAEIRPTTRGGKCPTILSEDEKEG